MTQSNVPSKLVMRLQAVSRNGNGMFGELCGQAAAEILRLTADIAHRDELEKFAAPLSCEIHGLMPNMALFDHKCPACERDRARGVPETGARHE